MVGTLPAFSPDGKLFLAPPGLLAEAPDGNGAFRRALDPSIHPSSARRVLEGDVCWRERFKRRGNKRTSRQLSRHTPSFACFSLERRARRDTQAAFTKRRRRRVTCSTSARKRERLLITSLLSHKHTLDRDDLFLPWCEKRALYLFAPRAERELRAIVWCSLSRTRGERLFLTMAGTLDSLAARGVNFVHVFSVDNVRSSRVSSLSLSGGCFL